MVKTVISLRGDGLGARLCAMAGALYIANRWDRHFAIIWPDDLWDASRNSLRVCFDPGWLTTWDPEFGHFGNIGHYRFLLLRSEIRKIEIYQEFKELEFASQNCPAWVWRGPYPPPPGDARFSDFRNTTHKLLHSKVAFHTEVLKAVESFARTYPLSACIGVHVRRGDLAAAPGGMTRFVSTQQFFEVLDERHPGSLLFVCCEDPAVVEEFKERYKERVFCLPPGPVERQDDAAMARALVEMILLSMTKELVGSASSFVVFASIYGDKDLNVLWPKN